MTGRRPALPGDVPFAAAVGADPRARIAAAYRWYGEVEAPGRSPLFAAVALAVADDRWCLDFLAEMPPVKWQPNLLLAAVRHLYGTPADPSAFIALVREHPDAVRAVMARRTTQTNEPGRCATLLPVLARLRPPLALLEVGASAGLCLLPDRYAYDFSGRRVAPREGRSTGAPVFPCRVDAGAAVPEANLQVAWRAGLDLNPLDLGNGDDVSWLEALVWPGQDERLARLRAACEVARADPPRVVSGDLRTSDLRALAGEAPPGATLVVFHTAVLAYIADAAERAAFAATVRDLGAVWIANERPDVIPGVPAELSHAAPGADAFLLCVDGEPAAWTDPHGGAFTWYRGA